MCRLDASVASIPSHSLDVMQMSCREGCHAKKVGPAAPRPNERAARLSCVCATRKEALESSSALPVLGRWGWMRRRRHGVRLRWWWMRRRRRAPEAAAHQVIHHVRGLRVRDGIAEHASHAERGRELGRRHGGGALSLGSSSRNGRRPPRALIDRCRWKGTCVDGAPIAD